MKMSMPSHMHWGARISKIEYIKYIIWFHDQVCEDQNLRGQTIKINILISWSSMPRQLWEKTYKIRILISWLSRQVCQGQNLREKTYKNIEFDSMTKYIFNKLGHWWNYPSKNCCML